LHCIEPRTSAPAVQAHRLRPASDFCPSDDSLVGWVSVSVTHLFCLRIERSGGLRFANPTYADHATAASGMRAASIGTLPRIKSEARSAIIMVEALRFAEIMRGI